ncbi:exonuclease domain-containing protein [Alienimonas chondri]|uniref:DNA polymerase III PolC-type n=1 Tax=Alienimonas chondri TaxID=2681879 RepID=A0ABX1VCN8_9PLAN|nr:exonuclease domain-containing protein [Alienimonas chondri]NNJ25814.1 DNA polymerase III PolC-type [Alienimonas chondri]
MTVPTAVPDPAATLADVSFVAFDLETTGCTAAADRTVEIGAVRFDLAGRELDVFEELVNPERPIPANVIRIHGITDAAVAGAAPMAEVAPRFLDWIAASAAPPILMAHNARFDMGFVGAGLARAGLSAPPSPVFDTVRLSRRRMPTERSHSLKNCAARFGVTNDRAHRALSDARALMAVFLNLVHRPPAVTTVGQLDALCGCGPMRAEIASPARSSSGGWPRRRRRYEPPSGDQAALNLAIANRAPVRIVYDGGTKGVAARSVTPRRLQRRGGELYLFAWCHSDDKEKQYRVDRIREVDAGS